MREEVAIILTASAPEFGDLVPLMNFLLQVERTVLLALKAASQMDHYQGSGTEPSESHVSFYADGPLPSLWCHQRSGVFQEGAGSVSLNSSTRCTPLQNVGSGCDGCLSSRTMSTLPQPTNKRLCCSLLAVCSFGRKSQSSWLFI